MSPTQADIYQEHAAAALASCLPHLDRLGASLSGIKANDAHRYGYHLSPARLAGTGHGQDYSLAGEKNRPVADMHAACAIDVGFGFPKAGEWLEALRKRVKAGQIPAVTELIGDPDLIVGSRVDTVKAMYASADSAWEWTAYTGDGHTAWCHVAIGRRYSGDTTIGDQLFGWWPEATPGVTQEDDMSAADIARFRAQLDELSDTIVHGTGPAYVNSVMRRDHGYMIGATAAEVIRQLKASGDIAVVPEIDYSKLACAIVAEASKCLGKGS